MLIAGTEIQKGETKKLNLEIAKLTSGTKIDIPVVISRGKSTGPVLLLMAGLHGDEINSVDVVRSVLEQQINKVESGTVICIPILNIFGFINFSREVPDGKDVNRSFPGYSKGSLASQIAYHLTQTILPHCDYIIDFHTGGKSRFNTPQVRAVLTNQKCADLAQAFNAPFTLHSNLISNSLRETATKKEKTIIVYEGGEAKRFDKKAKSVAVLGIKKVLNYLNMADYAENINPSKTLMKRRWVRAPVSGFFHPRVKIGEKIKQEQLLGTICGPLGDYQENCIANKKAYVISLNNNPVVNRGDAIIQVAYGK
jgi:predicted deacylase